VDVLIPVTRWSLMTIPMSFGAHLLCREEMIDEETVDICAGLLFVGGVADKLEWM
jgi:hypothetical protein